MLEGASAVVEWAGRAVGWVTGWVGTPWAGEVGRVRGGVGDGVGEVLLGVGGHHTGLPQYHHEFIKFSRTSRRPLHSNGTATTALIAPTYHAADFLAKPSLGCGYGGAGKKITLQNNTRLFLSSLVETDDGGRSESPIWNDYNLYFATTRQTTGNYRL